MQWSAHHPLIVAPDRQSVLQTFDDPHEVLRAIEQSTTPTWAGFLSYDLGRFFEVLPECATDDLHLPLIAMSPYLSAPVDRSSNQIPPRELQKATSTFARRQYLQSVGKCIEYIAAGDVFQVNLSQRFTAPLVRTPGAIFDYLRTHFPAAYAAYLDFGDYQLISNSPELFLRVERLPDGRRRIVNRPIKGTRPRLVGMESELLKSEKDKAELAMIVDLQRNDLGRICEVGSVRVTTARAIEAHPTVYHGVATIEGVLRRDVTLTDILRATFPCGSVTGCPKIRAMEIIEELEPVRRGPYCGAIGWIAPDGTMELSVAIRTMIIRDNKVHIPVGGGIVADSDPQAEYDETLVKARAMFEAAGVALPD
ncbi:MAG: anthranilate synthase component I family protein [Burkholderiales bacterium]|nr:anthranilate synthase component I family protein [Phycisphaerae bacterium]